MTFQNFVHAVALFCLSPQCVFSAESPSTRGDQPLDLDCVFSVPNITPRGVHYQATVPDTLDLSERAVGRPRLDRGAQSQSGVRPLRPRLFQGPAPVHDRAHVRPSMDAGKANWEKSWRRSFCCAASAVRS